MGEKYPHAAGQTLYVRPNACNPYGWMWYEDSKCSDDDTMPPPTKRKKAAKAPRKGKGKAAPSLQEALDTSYGSIMEAYEVAAPGSVIKLLPGRHMLTNRNKDREVVWKGLRYRKSVQIVALEGVSREQVLVGTDPGEHLADLFEEPCGVLPICNADVRFERLTFQVTSSFSFGLALFGVGEGAGLWLDDCVLMCGNDASLDADFAPHPRGFGLGCNQVQVTCNMRL